MQSFTPLQAHPLSSVVSLNYHSAPLLASLDYIWAFAAFARYSTNISWNEISGFWDPWSLVLLNYFSTKESTHRFQPWQRVEGRHDVIGFSGRKYWSSAIAAACCSLQCSNSSTSLLLRPGQGVVRTELVFVKVTSKETSLHGHWPGGGGAWSLAGVPWSFYYPLIISPTSRLA